MGRRGNTRSEPGHDLTNVPLVGVQDLLGSSMTHPQTTLDSLDALIEDLLNIGHGETLVSKVLGIIIVVELTSAPLLVSIIERIVVSKAIIIIICIIGVPGLISAVRVSRITHDGGNVFDKLWIRNSDIDESAADLHPQEYH